MMPPYARGDLGVPESIRLKDTTFHLLNNILSAASDYELAEQALSRAYEENALPSYWESAARHAKRRAAELAIAIDGLTDRAARETGLSKTEIRKRIATLCHWPGTTNPRPGSSERVRGVANAYKHQNLSDPTLPIASDADVLVVSLGYGLDGYGVGKFGGVEVIVRETAGASWKFLGDAPTTIAAWFQFLVAQGAALPAGPYLVSNMQVHP